ncbi:unnamed protein product [Chrysoparadoxa australica]
MSVSAQSLGQAFRSLASTKDRGLKHSFDRLHSVDMVSSRLACELREELEDMEGPITLSPFQVETVVNTVYRPTSVTCSSLSDPSIRFTASSDSRDSDLGRLSIIDLFPGSGKTLPTCLAALLFCRRRGSEVAQNWDRAYDAQKRNTIFHGGLDGATPPPISVPSYSNCICVFAPGNTLHQWQAEFSRAADMIGESIRFGPSTKLCTPTEDEIVVYLYNHKKGSRLHKFVGVVIVDEVHVRGEHNAVTLKSLPVFGRLIAVSASAGEFQEAVFMCSKQGILRRIIPRPDMFSESNCRIGLSSTLPTSTRDGVMEEMALLMDQVPLRRVNIPYLSNGTGTMLFGGTFDVLHSSSDVMQRVQDTYSISLKNCKTVLEMLQVIDDSMLEVISNAERGKRKRLRRLLEEATKKCPICMEEEDEMVIVGGCLHSYCKGCLASWMEQSRNRKCPLCRGEIISFMTPREVPPVISSSTSLEELAIGYRNKTVPLQELVATVGSALEQYLVDGGTRAVVISPVDCPQMENFLEGIVRRNGYGFLTLTKSSQKHKSGECLNPTLESFRAGGRNVLFAQEGKNDSVTGVNLECSDALFCVGDGNSAQRIGRLTRWGVTGAKTVVEFSRAMD